MTSAIASQAQGFPRIPPGLIVAGVAGVGIWAIARNMRPGPKFRVGDKVLVNNTTKTGTIAAVFPPWGTPQKYTEWSYNVLEDIPGITELFVESALTLLMPTA